MHIERKFIRNYLSKPRFSYGVAAAFLVLCLCAVACLFYWNPQSPISNELAASYDLIATKHEFWRLFTTTFIHGDFAHLLSNSLMLYILLYFVTSYYGGCISVIVSFSLAMLTNYIVLLSYGGETVLVGASGVVYYLWGFWMVLYLFIQRQYSISNRLLRMGGVFLIILIPSEFQPNTSYLAHGVGFGLGVGLGFIYYLFNREKIHQAEVWKTNFISDELSALDEIALSYPAED